MGNMAQDKFRRIMSRELSHLSERSRSGQFVAEWVNNFTASEGNSNNNQNVIIDEFSQSVFRRLW